ncbi:MAG TPA: hypothetical protein VJ851_17090 [Jatrophihabitans sp.]|nr:hypothetical protein [Jatrophihabitans sp.]
MSQSDPLASMLCASKVLQGDDEGINWESLDGLFELAVYGMLTHLSLAHDGELLTGCRLCAQSELVWQNSLIGRLLRERADS